MFWSKKRIGDLVIPPFSQLVKRTRILVIDNDKNSFPLEILRKEGYAIDYWPKVENLSKLQDGSFDIIFLDIQDVATEYSKDDGMGILELIKETNPSQIVVAFSAHSYDLGKNKFWKLADDSLCKPVDAATCKKIIDDLIVNKITPEHYWSAVTGMLNQMGVDRKKTEKIESDVVDAINKKSNKSFGEILESYVGGGDKIVRLVLLIEKISALIG
jgi:two-component SAPR family response regulator